MSCSNQIFGSLFLGALTITQQRMDVGGCQRGVTNVEWVRDALINGTFIGVTDGSYDREKAMTVSGTWWIIVCKSSQRTLHQGSFFEKSTKAGSYQGKLLGPVALHTFVTTVAQFFSLDQVTGWIYCNNIAALNQSSKNRKRVSTGVKHSDLHRAIRMLKCSLTMSFQYRHVQAHQNRLMPWSRLSLEEQLNVICDEWANGAVRQLTGQSETAVAATGESRCDCGH
jgi:hypothetical protein